MPSNAEAESKICLIGTGGTIACVPGEEGLKPSLRAAELLECIHMAGAAECEDLFSMDSSNIQPEEWVTMAHAIKGRLGRCGAIVITHGTDTMAYTASMLSFMLQNIPIPVVLTGSQLPMVYPDSDGRANLKNALIAAGSLPGGVYICFGDRVILGCRAVKTRTTSLDAFESINHPYVGTVQGGRYISLCEHSPRGGFEFFGDIEPRVVLLKLIPGISAELILHMAGGDVKGMVVEAFGLGGVHNVRRDHSESLARIMQGGTPVVLTSQCLYEGSSPDIYQVSRSLRDAGVISAGDMTSEAAVTKLMWVLKKAQDAKSVRQMMLQNYCGEIRYGL